MLRDSCNCGCRCESRAFLLLEAMLALTILSVGIIGLMGTILLSRRVGAESLWLAEATSLAQRQLEEAIAQPAQQMPTSNGASGRFSWTISLSDKAYDLKAVSVDIHWIARGSAHRFRLSRVFRPRYVNDTEGF